MVIGYYRVIYGALRGQSMRLQSQARLQQQLLAGCRDAGVFFDPLLQVGHSLVVRHRVREGLSGHHVQDVNQLRDEGEDKVMCERAFKNSIIV